VEAVELFKDLTHLEVQVSSPETRVSWVEQLYKSRDFYP